MLPPTWNNCPYTSKSTDFHDPTVGADQSNRCTIVRTEPQAERVSMVLVLLIYHDGKSYTVNTFDRIVLHQPSIRFSKIDVLLGLWSLVVQNGLTSFHHDIQLTSSEHANEVATTANNRALLP